MVTLGMRRGRRAWVVLGLGLYVLVLVVSPVLHHDLACHLKSPTHCAACTATPSAPRVMHAVHIDLQRLPDAGRVEVLPESFLPSFSPLPVPGRSPPV